jgi:hypothetical protein
MRLGIGFVLADPHRYLLLCLSRVPAYFEFWPSLDSTWLQSGPDRLIYFSAAHALRVRAGVAQAGRGSAIHAADFSIAAGADTLFVLFYSLMHILTGPCHYRLPVDR